MFSSSVMAVDDRVNLRVSVGNSFQARNDVQIPNTSQGTRFSLFDAVGEGPVSAARVEFNWIIKERHGIRVMLAPLSYTESLTFNEPVMFDGESFSANQQLDASYRFNSWRIGYHYSLKQSDSFSFRVGGTLKVRDAEIRLQQGSTLSVNDNLGFVPLLYLAAKYKLSDRWTIGADLDGLAGGPGRAIDLGLTLDFAISNNWQLGADIRVLDGGAAVEEVYNFARFNSAAVALSVGF